MGTGVGEAMLISAAVGATTGGVGAAVSGGDPLKGALIGAGTGALSGGVGSAIGGLGGSSAGALSGAESVIGEQALSAANPAFMDPTLYPGGVPDINAASSTTFAPPPVAPPPVAPPPVQPLGIDALSGSQINAPQAQINQGITSLNNVASQNPVTSFNPTDNPAPPAPKGMFDFGYKGPTPNVFEYGPQSNAALAMTGATSGIAGASQAERDRYDMPSKDTYNGPLSRFKYDPSTYNPDVVRPPNPIYKPVYAAEGGIMSLAPNGMAMGGVATRPPQTNFANPASYEEGTSQYSMATDPMSGNIANRMAAGGIASLGSYSDGGRMLKGPGDGMSDDIPAMIGKKQPARLADGEFVIPADVVSHLGNGSTDAGAKKLYSMMGKVRKARVGTKKQGKQINPNKYLYA
jgi:hypothetical protein